MQMGSTTIFEEQLNFTFFIRSLGSNKKLKYYILIFKIRLQFKLYKMAISRVLLSFLWLDDLLT